MLSSHLPEPKTYADYRTEGKAMAVIDGKTTVADRAALEILAANAMRLATALARAPHPHA